MGKVLYSNVASPNCRSILGAMKAANVTEIEVKNLDLLSGENKKEEYLKINPDGVVPGFEDDGFCLQESRAILAYIISKYGKDDSLYPKDPAKRAMVDRFLYYDLGSLQPKVAACVVPMFAGKTASEEDQQKYKDQMKHFDGVCNGIEFLTGPKPTIADFCVFASITQMELLGADFSEFPNVVKYLERAEKLESFSSVHNEFKQFVAAMAAGH